MNIEAIHQLFLESSGVSTDTRDSLEEKIYFALKGEHFDGNQYALEALKKGAKACVVDQQDLESVEGLIVVKDVLKTLQELARFHRRYLQLPILAITGSNGKTTTKELISAVLTQRFATVFTQGNLNNHIGVPLTLLSMNSSTEMGVVEMGANHQKEIEFLCSIAEPDYGYITNFGKAHLEGFGGFEGVIKGKSELYDYIKSKGKMVFFNADDSLQVRQSEGVNRYSFGQSNQVQCSYQLISSMPFVKIGFENWIIESHLLGQYNALNIAATVAVGKFFEVPPVDIKKAIENYIPQNNRSQIMRRNDNEIILDAYNANPTSMRLALENLHNYPAERKIVFLGDMFEVGETSLAEHQSIVNLLESYDMEAYVCGESFYQTQSKTVYRFKYFESLAHKMRAMKISGATILIKGSRGMQMERILNYI